MTVDFGYNQLSSFQVSGGSERLLGRPEKSRKAPGEKAGSQAPG